MKDTDMGLAQLHSKFPKLITSLENLRERCKLPEEIPIVSPEQPVSTRRPRAQDKQPEEIPIASPEGQNSPCLVKGQRRFPLRPRNSPCLQKGPVHKECGLPSTKKNKRHSTATDTWKKAYEDQLSKVRELQETNAGLRGQVAAKDAEKLDVHALARTEVQGELEDLKRLVTKLEDFKRSMTTKEKAAEETHL
ncbi:hypothetical protein R1flu_022641 [Riccia fluitans]|uniref:Uncharacterized protein n=1 Tax=Riccia fluitans TaxID=41844 RepID=A0ABD1XQ94_9MARC